MTVYAHVTAGAVDQVGQPPALHFDGTRWWDLRPLDPALLSAFGWLPLVEVARPADTETTTHDLSHAMVDGQPSQVWTPRPWTADELAAKQAEADRAATRTAIKAIVTDLQAEKARAQVVIDKANNQIGGADTKDVARAAKRIADAAIDLARFVRDM